LRRPRPLPTIAQILPPQDQLVGEWVNINNQTRTAAKRVVISKNNDTWFIKKWASGGRAPKIEIPDEERKLHLVGSNVVDKSLTYGFASYDAGFKEDHTIVHIEKDQLVVETFNIFKDDSKRSNYRTRETFERKK
jgi:hypothetical protein